jgi:lipopolysaccharide biosynthesis regulator YciM
MIACSVSRPQHGATCHAPSPARSAVSPDRVPSVAQYHRLRQNTITQGTFDFGEWSMNELAHTLSERSKTAEAITMLELNQEFYPQAAEIDFMIAELHRQRGERDLAITRYRATLQKDPNNQRAKRRLTELGAT